MRASNSPTDPVASRLDFPLWRFALFVLIGAWILWFGGIHTRALIGNDLLQSGTVEFADYVDPQAEREIYRLLSITAVLVMAAYALVITSAIVFLATSPFRLKDHGWLLMSAILLFLFVPVEIYTLYLDWKMVYLEFYTTADNGTFREVFLARVNALQGTLFIAVLCYYTIVALAVFQPFKRTRA